MTLKPNLISGGNHKDDRGIISFVNDFRLDQVKRFYTIEHLDVNVVRAWQGHKIEQKWFYVVAGSFELFVVGPDHWESPSDDLEVNEFGLSEINSQILHVPGGYATGFRALEAQSKLIVFSDLTVEQSSNDNYRFEQCLWHDWNKK